MNTPDIINGILVLGFVILVVCFVYITYYLIQALKSITSLADNLDDTTQGIKEKLQLKFLAAIPALMVALVGKLIRKKRG